jgi:biopolymer transport protein ExbB
MFNYSLTELFTKGGITLIILILCSILSIKVVIEKWIIFKGISEKVIDEFKKKISDIVSTKEPKDAVYACYTFTTKKLFFKIKSPLSNIFIHILENHNLNKEDLTESAFSKMDREIIRLEKGLGILATLGAISPFIGLFGTVIGIIKSFEALAINESSNYLNVMSGIAEALISTAAGLLVAIPAVMFYNYFSKQLKLGMHLIEDSSLELIRTLKSNSKVKSNA